MGKLPIPCLLRYTAHRGERREPRDGPSEVPSCGLHLAFILHCLLMSPLSRVGSPRRAGPLAHNHTPSPWQRRECGGPCSPCSPQCAQSHTHPTLINAGQEASIASAHVRVVVQYLLPSMIKCGFDLVVGSAGGRKVGGSGKLQESVCVDEMYSVSI